MIQLRTLAILACALLGSCSTHLFTGMLEGVPSIDRSRPVALIEVRDQPAKLGATTNEGIVFLNASNAKGPCRVHYFLAGDLIVDDGEIIPFGGAYAIADIILKTQAVPVLTRELTAEDELVALVLEDRDVEYLDVTLSKHSAVSGYAIDWPDRDLPEGTGIFTYRSGAQAGELTFVGLASGMATLNQNGTTTKFITFTGPARMREALATPRPLYKKREVIHRPDGISISR